MNVRLRRAVVDSRVTFDEDKLSDVGDCGCPCFVHTMVVKKGPIYFRKEG